MHSFLIAWLVIVGDDIWRYVGKLTDAQKSMLDDRFKWKVSPKCELFCLLPCFVCELCFHRFACIRSRKWRKEEKGDLGMHEQH